MEPFFSKSTRIKLTLLAWYQIIGGIVGLCLLIWLLTRIGQINGLVIIICLITITLYGFSVYCGRLLLTDKYMKGLRLSFINQAIQIPQVAMFGYTFWYVSGSMLTLGLNAGNGNYGFNFNFSVASTFQISIATQETQVILAINLVAIYGIYFVRRLKSTIAEEKETYDLEKNIDQEFPSASEESTQGPEPTF